MLASGETFSSSSNNITKDWDFLHFFALPSFLFTSSFAYTHGTPLSFGSFSLLLYGSKITKIFVALIPYWTQEDGESPSEDLGFTTSYWPKMGHVSVPHPIMWPRV